MKDLTNTSNELVAQIFADYHQSVFFYIYKKIGKKEDAEDLVQDAYLRLLEYRAMLRPDTVKYFLFTIVRNLVSDYFRHLYRKQEASVYLEECGQAQQAVAADTRAVVRDLQKQELMRVKCLMKISNCRILELKMNFTRMRRKNLSRKIWRSSVLI